MNDLINHYKKEVSKKNYNRIQLPTNVLKTVTLQTIQDQDIVDQDATCERCDAQYCPCCGHECPDNNYSD